MFKNLPFAYKIGLLPVLASLAFVLILSTSWLMGRQGIQLVDNIEQGYYASLALNRDLSTNLEEIQRTFQDAAASADLDALQEADVLRDRFVATVQQGMQNEIVDVSPLSTISNAFNRYYTLARTTTQQYIEGNVNDELFVALQDTAIQVQALQKRIEVLKDRDKGSITAAFANTEQSIRRSTQILMAVIVVSLALLFIISMRIIRVAAQSVRRTVSGMDALVKGDLDSTIEASSTDEMGEMVNQVGQVRTTVNELANEISTLIEAVRAGDLKSRGNPENFQGAYASLINGINELIEEFVAPIEVTAQYVERIANGDIPQPISEEYEGDFNQIKGNLNTLVAVMNGLIAQTATLTTSAKAGELDRRGSADDFSGAWSDLINGINETLDAVTEPMRAVSEVMSSMAQGDLTHKIEGNYHGTLARLQQDTNTTIDRLTDVIGSIMQSGSSVWIASNEIAEGNQSLLVRTQEQARSLQHTTGNMENMTKIVRQNADNARRASETVLAAREKAQKGGDVVGNAMRAMDEINASSNRISEIINVINEIAFQTNLLALNASVEAARAGEDGRGFAVVASEVRNLAGRSANAAKEINELIQDSVGKVEEGSRLVNESGRTLDEIMAAVADVTAIVGEISESSGQQANSIESVNVAVAQMEQITNQNATLVHDANRSSNALGTEARKLRNTTEFFRVERQERADDQDDADRSPPALFAAS